MPNKKNNNNNIKKELVKILDLMLIEAEIDEKDQEDILVFNILPKNEEDIKFLVGWHGQNLTALQTILKIILSKKLGEDYLPFTLDISNYRQKKEETLRNMAALTAAKVKETKRSIVLDPMTSAERRIIHLSLADFSGITTESIGEDRDRRTIIKIKE